MKTPWLVLVVAAVCAFALRFVVWFALPSQVWPDEIFQSLEQAHRLVFGYGVVPWEFREGARSWLLPGTLAAFMAAASVVSSSVIAYLGACAAFLTAVSVVPIWTVTCRAAATYGARAAIVAAAVLVTWFELVYFAPKALTEVVGGHCLLVGVLYADATTLRRAVLATVMLSLAAVLRIQLAPACAIVWFVLAWRMRRHCLQLAAAGLAVIVTAGLLDWMTWGYPFQSFVENVRFNIVERKSELFGVSPWYEYFRIFARVWGAWGIVVLALAAIGARTRPLVAIAFLVTFATHAAIAHKEYRFMYPAMALVITLGAFGSAQLVKYVESKGRGTLAAIALAAIWIAASLRGASRYTESTTRGDDVKNPQWHFMQSRGGLLAFDELHNDPAVCGIAIIGLDPFMTGGYSHLHRDIPLFLALNKNDLPQLAPLANVFLVYFKVVIDKHIGEFELDHCISEVCIFRRAGTCREVPGYSFNSMLTEYGH